MHTQKHTHRYEDDSCNMASKWLQRIVIHLSSGVKRSDPTSRVSLVATTILMSLKDILAGCQGKQHTCHLLTKGQEKAKES